MRWLKTFRCNTGDLPYRRVLAGFIDESAESGESACKKYRSFFHGGPCTWPQKNVENSLKSLKILSHTVRTPRARTHQQQLACIAGMHTVELSDRKLAQKFSCIARARRARAGLTVYPPWIQTSDVFRR
jgi:hypothetical protein